MIIRVSIDAKNTMKTQKDKFKKRPSLKDERSFYLRITSSIVPSEPT